MKTLFALVVLGLCSQASGLAVGTKTAVDLTLQKGNECSVCQTVIGDLKASVQDQAQIKETIGTKICPLLGSLAYECKQNASFYSGLIYEMVNAMNPPVVCERMGSCRSRSMSWLELVSSVKVETGNVKVMTQLQADNGAMCNFCRIAVEEVERLLANKESVNAIEKVLEIMCDLLPVMSNTCKSFVDHTVPMIIKLLAKKESPDVICHQVHMC